MDKTLTSSLLASSVSVTSEPTFAATSPGKLVPAPSWKAKRHNQQ